MSISSIFHRIVSGIILVTPLSFPQGIFTNITNGEARDRSYDVLHYKIELSFDESRKMVLGKVRTTFVPLLPSFHSIEFDAEEMHFSSADLVTKKVVHTRTAKARRITTSVVETTKSLHFATPPAKVKIMLDKGYSFDDTLTISLEYSCTPKKGLYFIQPDSAYPTKPRQIWTQGEAEDNHWWVPCYDFPNDKATSELIATVPGNYTVLSNGKLIGVSEDKQKGTRTFHWSETRPHSSYLMMMAAGEYVEVQDSADGIPLEYYVYPYHVADARICFKQSPDIMRFFNRTIGYKYPWEKYAQVIIADFMFGGMENTTATALKDDIAVYDARMRLDSDPASLIAHEMAHQWWGDVVTCKDWRHLWLNESFASYFDLLYQRHYLGEDDFQYMMDGSLQAGISSDKSVGRRPIVSVDSYGANLYPRGASVLHMLRFVLGDALFWRSINHYITKYQFTAVETDDFKSAIEEATGQNLYWFFDEWVYKAGYPIFDVSYSWNDSAKAVSLRVRQTQTIDSLTGIFRIPVDIEVTTAAARQTTRVIVAAKETTFVIPVLSQPLLVIFDKGNWLIKELHFQKSTDELRYQARNAPHPMDRVRAIQELILKTHNEEIVPLLLHMAQHDPFWGVRQEAISLFGRIQMPGDSLRAQMKEALIEFTRDQNAKIRNTAVSQLRNFKDSDVAEVLQHIFWSDSSYYVVAAALRSFARVDSSAALNIIPPFLDMPSHTNIICNAALNTLASLDSVRVIEAARAKAQYGQPMNTRNTAFEILRRYGKGNHTVQTILSQFLSDPNSSVRVKVAQILGDIGDDQILPALERIAADEKEAALATVAKGSVERIKKRQLPASNSGKP